MIESSVQDCQDRGVAEATTPIPWTVQSPEPYEAGAQVREEYIVALGDPTLISMLYLPEMVPIIIIV